MKPLFSSLSEIQRELAAGTTSCRQLVEYYLDNIAQRNAELNVFLEVWADEARQQAAAVDEKLALGTAGRLAGMVIGLKDVLAYEGHSLQSSSRNMATCPPPRPRPTSRCPRCIMPTMP